MFDLSTVVKPLPVNQLKSLSTAAFERILNCESKFSDNIVVTHY